MSAPADSAPLSAEELEHWRAKAAEIVEGRYPLVFQDVWVPARILLELCRGYRATPGGEG